MDACEAGLGEAANERPEARAGIAFRIAMAAGLLLVTEAGGTWTNADGGEDVLDTGGIVAGNPDIQPLILERLKAAA